MKSAVLVTMLVIWATSPMSHMAVAYFVPAVVVEQAAGVGGGVPAPVEGVGLYGEALAGDGTAPDGAHAHQRRVADGAGFHQLLGLDQGRVGEGSFQ